MSAGEFQLNRIREVMEQAHCDMVDILSTMVFGEEFYWLPTTYTQTRGVGDTSSKSPMRIL